MTASNQYVPHILSTANLLQWMSFLYEAWLGLHNPQGGRGTMSWDEFLKVCLHIINLGPERGIVVVFTSKNDKPLGLMVVMDNTELFSPERTALIYAGYSNGKYEHAAVDGTSYVEDWARAHGYKELHAQTRRLNGSAKKLFERKLGFTESSWLFKKTL
jgi:hypothetical protein